MQLFHLARLSLFSLLFSMSVGCVSGLDSQLADLTGEEPTLCNGGCDGLFLAGDDLECHGVSIDPWSRACVRFVIQDGDACTSGTGTCLAGVCRPPAVEVGVACALSKPVSLETCQGDEDCDDGNPCTKDGCPSPGCGPCRHVPAEDGASCSTFGNAGTCTSGACCAP